MNGPLVSPKSGSLEATPETLLDVARSATDAGARVAMAWWKDQDLRVEEKAAADDLVSQADREAERAIREVIAGARPCDEIVGEEGGVTAGTSGFRWFVDPIDGTTSYLYGRHDWAVSVAAMDPAGRIVVGVVAEPALGRLTEASLGGGTWSAGERVTCAETPALDQALVELNLGRRAERTFAGDRITALATRVRDLRRSGSAAAALAQVATRRANAYWGPGLRPWDAAAGMLLVEEAGGLAGGLDGPSGPVWPESGDILAAEPSLWEPLRAVLGSVTRGEGWRR